jgi:putative membrane protein insertion efficiency factor
LPAIRSVLCARSGPKAGGVSADPERRASRRLFEFRVSRGERVGGSPHRGRRAEARSHGFSPRGQCARPQSREAPGPRSISGIAVGMAVRRRRGRDRSWAFGCSDSARRHRGVARHPGPHWASVGPGSGSDQHRGRGLRTDHDESPSSKEIVLVPRFPEPGPVGSQPPQRGIQPGLACLRFPMIASLEKAPLLAGGAPAHPGAADSRAPIVAARAVDPAAGLIARSLLLAIRAYQLLLAPLLGPCCRFEPSCSRYTAICIERQGAVRGVWLGVRRLMRCHPFCAGGHDPPPETTF